MPCSDLFPAATNSPLAELAATPFTRRSALRAGGLASLTALLGSFPGLIAPRTASAAASCTAPSPTPTPTSGSAVLNPAPFSVQASCELSEDYFETDNVPVLSGDTVVPFTSASGQVEAFVVAEAGGLSHLYRDPTATSGWTYQEIFPSQTLTTSLAACVTTSEGGTVVLCRIYAEAQNRPNAEVRLDIWLFNETANTWHIAGSQLWPGTTSSPDVPLSIHGGLTPTGSPYIVSVHQGGAVRLWTQGAGNTFSAQKLTGLPGAVHDLIVLWDQSGDNKGSAVALAGSTLSVYPQNGLTSFDSNASSSFTAASLLWAGWAPKSADTTDPLLAYQAKDGTVQFIQEGTMQGSVPVPGETLGNGQVAVWQQDDLYSFAYLDDSIVSVIAQYGDPNRSSTFTDPIPLQPGVARIYSQPDDPSQATLFVVDTDTTLSVLAKDPTSGWSLTPVQQAYEQVVETTSWVVMIRMLDSNGAGVSGAQFKLSASQPIWYWQPDGSGLLTGESITMTTDETGVATFSLPTTELDSATLTAQALSDGGQPVGDPFVITPDTDVRNFLAGQGQLTDIGSLTGSSLLAAQNDDGSPLLPGLTSLPTSQQATAAGNTVAAMNHIAQLGLGSTPQSATDPRAAKFDLSGSAPTFQTSTDPNAYDSVTAVHGLVDWWNSVEHDAHSVFHAVRHAAVKTEGMITSWSDDTKQWTIQLIVTVTTDVQSAITWTVTTFADAIHAISGFFQTLGADLKKAWDWLKHHILALLKAVGTNAAQLETWLEKAGGEFTTIVDGLEDMSNHFFSNLEDQLHAKIAYLASVTETMAFGTSAPLPPPTSDTGSSDLETIAKGIHEATKIMNFVSGRWLWHKVKAHLPKIDGNGGPSSVPAGVSAAPALEALAKSLSDTMLQFGEQISNIFQSLFDSVQHMSEASIGTFFSDLDALVCSLLQLADDFIVQILDMAKIALDAIDKFLDYEMSSLPFIGKLLALVRIDPTITIKHIVALLVAFPATLAYECATGSTAMFPSSGVSKVEGVNDPWGCGLNWMAYGVQMIWSLADSYEDFNPENSDKWPAICTYIDNLSPLALGVLGWPSQPVDGKTPPPFSPTDTGGPDGAMIDFFQVLGIAPSLLAFGVYFFELDSAGTFSTVAVPILNCLTGVGSTVLTSLWNWENDQATEAKVAGIMGELSYVFSPLGIKQVAEATDGWSYVIKLIVDWVGNFGTAVEFAGLAMKA